MISKYFSKIRNVLLKRAWKRRNTHNYTSISRANSIDYIEVGNYTYGILNVHISNNVQKLKIGNFCSIAANVMFILSADHDITKISSYPFKSQLLSSKEMEGLSKGDIIVESDVWIGYGAIILSGTHIGQGAVIAAGAVVTKDVPPYAVVGGNPARVLKYRFPPNIIDELMKIDYSKVSKDFVEKNINMFYEKVDVALIQQMPQK